MGLFQRKESWERTFRLTSRYGASKGVLAVFFWLWGIVGLFFNAGTLFGLIGNIGVGTSAYLTATCLVWIGGRCCLASAPYSLTQILMANGRVRRTTATCG
ncbi:hypothetical protein [Bradyrhizobium australafricanum]|uniref:hypothetical protein n=1 Tax=Bradyrhizobium australafricanum TaxID=2821406 RepID=UPI001CE3187D|nr:hypothetical protein [Bradyrhizobium australafricanum]MCA6104751.1 hypothetical protein [Bradyrhizobium australafricanum]